MAGAPGLAPLGLWAGMCGTLTQPGPGLGMRAGPRTALQPLQGNPGPPNLRVPSQSPHLELARCAKATVWGILFPSPRFMELTSHLGAQVPAWPLPRGFRHRR